MNTYVNDDTVIAAVEEILAGQPAVSPDGPLHDPSHVLPLTNNGGGGTGGTPGC